MKGLGGPHGFVLLSRSAPGLGITKESLTMKRALLLLAVALPALAAPVLLVPALAQSACMEPAAPTMPDGKTAARAEIIAAAGAAKEFITKSDEYQGCLNAEYEATVKTGQAAAKADKSNRSTPRSSTRIAKRRSPPTRRRRKRLVRLTPRARLLLSRQIRPPRNRIFAHKRQRPAIFIAGRLL